MPILKTEHYGDKQGLLVLSYGAIITLVVSNRNYGKTWAFKKRGVRRFLKRGKKTLWLRVFRKEAKEAAASFFSSSDLRAYCGLSWYDKKTGKGNLRRNGNAYEIRRGSQWDWAFKILPLCDADAIRSCDDVKLDTIVIDEFMKTPAALRRYRGNFMDDVVDIFFSSKREHELRIIMLGNKEAYHNPVLSYFHIAPPPEAWEGIRAYRDGGLVLQQINNAQAESVFENKVQALFNGTRYGAYVYEGRVKGAATPRTRKCPAEASLYAQIDFDGAAFAIRAYQGNYFVVKAIDRGRPVFATGDGRKWPRQLRLSNKSKHLFKAFHDAAEVGRLYYSSPALAEAAGPFMAFLGLK